MTNPNNATLQHVHVLNSLSGQPMLLVAQIAALLPTIINAVEESGWIKIDEINQPEPNKMYRVWNESFKQEMIAKFIPEFFISTEDEHFEGDTEYNEKDDRNYWPTGWYVFADHVGCDFTYGLCLDVITHFKPVSSPKF